MSFHPNDITRRARAAKIAVLITFAFLASAFFRTQIKEHEQYALQSEENRLREVPLPAPRGIIYDRHGQIIAENLPGYTVSILSPSADSLRASLRRLGGIVELTPDQIESAVRRYRTAPTRPTVVLADAKFDVVSVLEEHRIDFPSLIIQSTPKRFYPDSTAVASFVGYTGEITESELKLPQYQAYKPGQQIGKGGLEKEYETKLRGREGTHFVEYDARGRVVSEGAQARPDLLPLPAPPLQTNIDLDLQRFIAKMFADSGVTGGAIALEPRTGAVLALHSAPSFDPNRFIGGIPADYWKELNSDARKPLYNKVIQGKYPPGSTFKLATAVMGVQAGLVGFDDRMPIPCTGGMQYGSRYFQCWEKRGHGNLTLSQAIEKSCDVYFYQLGLKIGISKLVAGGVSLNFRSKSDIDLPNEYRPDYPYAVDYYNRRYGPRGWSNAVTLNLAIGQGENAQTIANMAKFYTALATDGAAATPRIARDTAAQRTRLFTLKPEQMVQMQEALAGVVERGTAQGEKIQGIMLAGKTGTAQNAQDPLHHHAWFVGYAPAGDPKIVVAVMIEFGGHGTRAAAFASQIISHYLKATPIQAIQTEG